MVKSQFTEYFNKKKFFFFNPHTLTIRLKRPVYRAFSGEGRCEGVRADVRECEVFYLSTRPLVYSSTCLLVNSLSLLRMSCGSRAVTCRRE